MKKLIMVLFVGLVTCSSTARTFDPDYNMILSPNFSERYEICDYTVGWFKTIYDTYTGKHAFCLTGHKKIINNKYGVVYDGFYVYQRTEFIYDDVGEYIPYAIPSSDGIPWYLVPIRVNGKWGFVDIGPSGFTPATRIKPMFDDVEEWPFTRDEYAYVRKNGRWFYIDKKGIEVH